MQNYRSRQYIYHGKYVQAENYGEYQKSIAHENITDENILSETVVCFENDLLENITVVYKFDETLQT